MSTEPVLTLAQWFSPAFPVGAFAWSHGLEWAIAEDHVRDRQTLQDWCANLLNSGTGLSDAIFLHTAFRLTDPLGLEDLADLCMAFCASSGRREESMEQGAAFARTLRDIHGLDLPDLPYPVAAGRAAKLTGLPVDLTLQFYLQAFAANLVSAAVRRIPLGQTDGQRVTAALVPTLPGIAAKAMASTVDDLENSCFVSDIASMRHETLTSKVFRT